MSVGVWGFGGLGFGGLGLKELGLGSRVSLSGSCAWAFMVWGLGFEVWGLGFGAYGAGPISKPLSERETY